MYDFIRTANRAMMAAGVPGRERWSSTACRHSALELNLSLGRLRDSVAWVQHTDDVLLEVASIDGDLVGAESTERGYLLTGDEAFRQTFQRLQEGLPGKLRDLLTLVADSAD